MKEKKSHKFPGNWCNPTRKCSTSIKETGAGGSKPNRTCDGRNYDSTSLRKLGASSPELKNMEYTNHQCMSKIFQFLR